MGTNTTNHPDYTIPSDNRELQLHYFPSVYPLIIPYQVITGNYNATERVERGGTIIPYQVITGNYNSMEMQAVHPSIIPYQVITGNYNRE